MKARTFFCTAFAMLPGLLAGVPVALAQSNLAAAHAYADVPSNQSTMFAGFDLDTLTLAQLADRLGAASLVETGERGTSSASLCYRTQAGLVHFFFDRAGGPEYRLTGFGISESSQDKDKTCTDWPSSCPAPDLSLNGIPLGISVEVFFRMMAHLSWDGADDGGRGYMSGYWSNEMPIFFHFARKCIIGLDQLPDKEQERIRRGEGQCNVEFEVTATFRDLKAISRGGKLIGLSFWKDVIF